MSAKAVPLCLLLALLGCGKSSPIVGTWTPDQSTQTANSWIHRIYKPDGSYTEHVYFKFPDGKVSEGDSVGTYALSGDELTMDRKSITFHKRDGTTDQQAGEKTIFKIAWKDNDHFTLSIAPGVVAGYSRIR